MDGLISKETCCGCIELKTGCFIIGYFHFLDLGVNTILYICLLMFLGNMNWIFWLVFLVGFLYLCIVLSFTVALLLGLHRNNPSYVKAFLNCEAVLTVLQVIGLMQQALDPNSSLPFTTTSALIGFMIRIFAEIYFLLVIRTQYHVMKKAAEDPANDNAYTKCMEADNVRMSEVPSEECMPVF